MQMTARTAKACPPEEIRDGPGKRDEIVVADNSLEVARDDRGGFGPADEESAEKVNPKNGPKIASAGISSVPMGST
jgi:hypothetical protein